MKINVKNKSSKTISTTEAKKGEVYYSGVDGVVLAVEVGSEYPVFIILKTGDLFYNYVADLHEIDYKFTVNVSDFPK